MKLKKSLLAVSLMSSILIATTAYADSLTVLNSHQCLPDEGILKPERTLIVKVSRFDALQIPFTYDTIYVEVKKSRNDSLIHENNFEISNWTYSYNYVVSSSTGITDRSIYRVYNSNGNIDTGWLGCN